ncbi:conserved exported hypothetical protein [Bradyrhizobium sp. ORS 375]|uniref:hypothetical protein n=1 Tax=Bradyrhizobium sp. (strain ORS 375) TaxID=566679 RepID=UPI00024073FF|nr:hypothetical protein [Bradyrhizobium sp. ORS 375]CCD90795.1 conserved exported hypothetical protein [Bradyrhizobium sp. ORS 375]
MTRLLVAAAIVLWSTQAMAGLAQRQIDGVALAPEADAKVPTDLVFKALDGKNITLGAAIGHRPTLLLPADFTCRQICGPALTIVSAALQQTGLIAGRDYSLVVVGIDARNDLADARRFAGAQVGGPGVAVLTGSTAAIDRLTTAIGYHFEADTANEAVAHPAALVTLSPGGRVTRALSSLALQPQDLRIALIEAGQGTIGGLGGRIALLCYGFDAVHRVYTSRIETLLQLAGAGTCALLMGAIALLLARARKSGAPT